MYFFKIDRLPKEICVLSSFSGDCCCIFFYPSCYIFMRTESKPQCLIFLGFAVLFCFSTLLDGSELALTGNKSLSYLLFITHVIYKAHIYSSDTKVGMSHILSKCHTDCQLHKLSSFLWRNRSHTWNHNILILTVWLGNIYIHWLLLSHYLFWRHTQR